MWIMFDYRQTKATLINIFWSFCINFKQCLLDFKKTSTFTVLNNKFFIMKKTTLLLLFVMVSYVIFAQSQVILNSTKTKAEIVQNSDQKLVFTNDIEGFYVDGVKTKDGMYSRKIGRASCRERV